MNGLAPTEKENGSLNSKNLCNINEDERKVSRTWMGRDSGRVYLLQLYPEHARQVRKRIENPVC